MSYTNDHYRPLARRIEAAMTELGTPVTADDADATAAVLQRDGVTDLYMDVIGNALRAHRTRAARRDGRRRND
jgi:hypothetical protein